MSRGRQPQIHGWVVVWPGVRICPLGLSISNVTDSFMGYLNRKHKKIETKSAYLTRNTEEPGAEAVRQ